MQPQLISTHTAKRQYLISITTVLAVAVICFFLRQELNYRVVALVLLLTVSIIAMLFDIIPVLLATIISACVWIYFFIPPIFTLDISNTEDLLMFLSYFFVALLNAVLTFKIRQAEKKARDKEEKEHTIKLYNTLLNSLSHELRTPIATILGTVDTLKDNIEKLDNAQQIDLLNEIDIAGIRLNRQVENILNMSRLESGILQPKRDWCDMNELINRCIQKVNAHHHTIIFKENEPLPLFKLDIGFTEQIVLNLLHNAVQYTPENSMVTIDVRHQNESCVLCIADNGGGIPEQERGFIFDKFYRLPNSKAGGSGLGLSIVKGFAEAQKGTVSVTNNSNNGATFTLVIPAEANYLNNLKNE